MKDMNPQEKLAAVIAEMRDEAFECRAEDASAGIFPDHEAADRLTGWADTLTTLLSEHGGGGEATPPDANWCRTCGRHRNDPVAILCRDGCHDKLRKTDATQPTPTNGGGGEAVVWPKVWGVGRMFDNEKALLVIFDRKPTDDELRAFDDFAKGTTPPPTPSAPVGVEAVGEVRIHDGCIVSTSIKRPLADGGYDVVPQRLTLPAAAPRVEEECPHEAWEENGGARRCADCRKYLGPVESPGASEDGLQADLAYLRNGELLDRDARTNLRAIADRIERRLAASGQGADAKDAARYRWMKQWDVGIDHEGGSVWRWRAYAEGSVLEPGLDAVVDAAMKEQA